jgi:hypothetical protein
MALWYYGVMAQWHVPARDGGRKARRPEGRSNRIRALVERLSGAFSFSVRHSGIASETKALKRAPGSEVHSSHRYSHRGQKLANCSL